MVMILETVFMSIWAAGLHALDAIHFVEVSLIEMLVQNVE